MKNKTEKIFKKIGQVMYEVVSTGGFSYLIDKLAGAIAGVKIGNPKPDEKDKSAKH